MSKLNEAAFLRSLSLDEEAVEQPLDSCPQPTILWALMQKDRSGSEMAEELRNHIAICPSCLDLTKRLYAFHRAVQGEPNQKAEETWAESRPKLNQWIDTFLSEQAKAKSRPAPTPLVLVKQPSRRKLFRLAWAMPLAGVVAVVAILVFVEGRHVDGNHGATQIASAPVRPEGSSSSTPPFGAPPSSSDQQMMSNGASEEGSAAALPETINFSGGERMKLQLSSVQPKDDGSYLVSGTLLPADRISAVFDSAEVSGIFRPAESQDHLKLRIDGAEFKGRDYRAGGMDDLLDAVATGEHTAPEVGQALEVRVERGPSMHLQPRN